MGVLDENHVHSVVAHVLGWEETKEAVEANGDRHPLEQASTIWNSNSKTAILGLNSNFNLVNSNWNKTAVEAIKSQTSSPEMECAPLYIPKDETASNIFTPLYKKDYNYGYRGLYNYAPQKKVQKPQQTNGTGGHDIVLSPQSVYVPPGSRFFVIKSFNEEDVRSSFNHKVWSSTEMGNRRLTKAFKSRVNNERIILFFSVNGSGKFCGVAEMMSPLGVVTKAEETNDENSGLWLDNRYKGLFKIQWLYVKDIYNNHFKHLKVPSNDFKSVTYSRDTQEVPFEVGCEMLDIFRRVRSFSSFMH